MAQRDADAAGSGVTQGANPFDALAKRDREKQDGAMQSALSDALKVLPDRAASDQYMAKTLGLPVDMVERNRDQVQQQFRLRELQQVMQASPVLRAQMSNPDFAKLAHDDAPVLNDLEQVMQFLGRSGKATLAGVAGISEGLWGLGRAASGYIPDAAGGRLLEDWTTYENQQARGVVQRLMPQAGGTVEAGWYSGLQSLGMNLWQLLLAFLPGGQAPLVESIAGQVTRMAPVLWSMGLTTGGQAYGEARDKGLTQAQAIMFGTSQGVIEAGTEMIGMPALFNVLKPGKTAAKIMEYMIKEQGGEQIATALQDMNEWAVLPENQGKSFGDYLRARPSAALQTAIATAVVGGSQVTLMKGVGMVINRAEYAAAKAQQAEAQAALLEQLNKVAQASSLQKRDADTFGALAEQQAAEYGASDTVYIDGNALMQSGLAQQVAQVSPAVAAQVQEAAATGGLVAIPTSEYAARIAPLQESAQLLDHLKFDPEGFTRAEAQVYMQTQGEQLQAEVDRALAVAEQTDAARAGMEAVRTQVLDQLNAANRFKPEVNGAYASLVAARYAVRAEQMGTTADELFKQRGLRVVAEGMPGVVLNQPGTLEQLSSSWKDRGIDATVSENKGIIRLAKIVVPESSRSTGLGTAAMQELTNYADATGQHIVLSPSADFGGNKARLTAFYKRFGFVENKGKNRAFSTSETMYRQAHGKVLYQGARAAQTESPEFKSWFGDSKVVDAEGKPLVVYHGTTSNITQFDPSMRGQNTGADSAKNGFFFTDDSVTAESYANYAATDAKIAAMLKEAEKAELAGDWDAYDAKVQEYEATDASFADPQNRLDGQNVMPVYLAMKNPLRVDAAGENASGFDIAAAVKQAIRKKHDGLIIENLDDAAGLYDRPATHYVVFNPGQIKSAIGNNGQFDPNDPSILKQGANGPRGGISPEQRAENFARFTDNAPLISSQEADSHDFKTGQKIVVEAYHGSARPDRIGSVFDPKRATSGPMAFFTSSPDLASNYAKGKEDTSLAYEDVQYANWFKFKPAGARSTVSIDRAWYSLTQEQKAHVLELAPQVTLDENSEHVVLDPSNTDGIGNYQWELQQTRTYYDSRGNPLKALVAQWLDSGSLFGQEEKFMDVLRLAGMPMASVEMDSPNASYPSVFKTYISMKNPLVVSDIPADVRSALEQAAKRDRTRAKPGADSWDKNSLTVREWWARFNDPDPSVATYAWTSIPDKVTDVLKTFGYDGIVDWSGKGGGHQSPVYVPFAPTQIKSAFNKGTFDSSKKDILKQDARGMFSPEQRAIALLKAADLSTFLHEAGHFFFEDDIALASELVAAQAQGATVSPGEQRILDDVGTLLTWHGLKGDLSQQLTEWHGLGFEERRAYHEKTAESFERYLLEGKAPSLELTPVFQRFRTWLVSVYRSLKDFVAGHPAAGELSPEVRQVFDRMLASEDQIALALQGRSLVPMFASAEEAGMTPEEFARYQESGRQATADAVDSLQARGIRDMQWLRNARSRMLKAKQKEAAGLRAGLETDARVEVYGEPIYRAWRFLTAKLREEDKLPEPVKTGTGQTLDPGKDSLLVAVAKLGGLDRQSAAEHLGVHADDFKAKSGVFGAPVFRKTGGLAADAMAERLAESGYLKADDALNVLEDKIASELRGDPQYSFAKDWAAAQGEQRAGDGVDVSALGAARLDAGELSIMGLPPEVVNTLKARKMVAAKGLHPDLVAEQFGFTSGDELVRKLALAEPPQERIDALVDVRMLEQHGELSSPEAIERATDEAIHNEARMRMVATEEATLAKATGKTRVLEKAAREYAAQLIARQKVRDLRPSQYTNAESRAAAEAAKARKAGDTARAAAEKRNQLLQGLIARAALKARDEMQQAVDYLRRFDKPSKTLDKDYADQIDQLLERFDLKPVSNKESEKRMALSRWMDSQREQGLEPEIPQELLDAAERKPWRELTVEEMRGLVDTVKQIEHLGRLKHRLLTARDQKAYEAVRDEIAASIREHAGKRKANARTSTTWAGKALSGVKMFGASHIKAATWARVLDGGKDGGPMWEHFVRGANERGDMEATMRAEATARLAEIMAPLFKLGRMSDKGTFFQTVGRSFNRQERLAIALNIGNDGNLQRLLGGEGWTVDQLKPVLQSLTAAEWHAVQAIWDHFETYRPQIAAKERRVYGKEPAWVEPRAFDVSTADGQNVSLRGGYYPIKYDPAASQRAEEHADAEGAQRQLRGAYTSATTRRSFTKARVEEVNGRPLLYSLAGVYGGVNDVIHDLAWHEWLIDTNRLLRSQTIDSAIRDHYGPEAKQQLKTWAQDIAEGDRGAQHALDMALGRLRQGISVAGLGFNFVSAAMQTLGITQSIVRVGAPWIGRGVMRYVANPVRATREANQLSAFMENRARTRFRELNELRNQVQDQTSVKEFTGRWAYWMMMRFQQMVDVPTWWGAYDKAMAEGNADERARALADQAVIDSQGGGETKDLSAIERGGSAQRLFTVFYSFMNTALNLGVAQGMTANTPAKKAKLAVDMLLIYTVPAVLGALFKDAITPGDAGDDDPEKLARKLAAEQISFLLGLFVVGREFADVGKIIAGADGARDYAGPAGTRMVGDTLRFGKQAMQGEFDDAFRKAAINLSGDLFGLPAAQVNRTITGAKALVEGETSNPAALAFGFQKPR